MRLFRKKKYVKIYGSRDIAAIKKIMARNKTLRKKYKGKRIKIPKVEIAY